MKIARLTRELEDRVRQGEWSAKGPLPPRSLLSEEYGVSPASVSIAIRHLEREGLVRIVPRKGVFVVEDHRSSKPFSGAAIGLRGGYLPTEAELLSIDARQLFSRAIFNGIWETASTEECPLLLLPGEPSEVPPTPESFRESGIHGVIFMGGRYYEEALALRRRGFPVILANRPVGGTPLNFVDYDAAGELEVILQRFIGLGHRRIAVLCPAQTSIEGYYNRLKLDYIDTLARHGLPFHPERDWRAVDRTRESDLPAIIDEWSSLPEKPTAIFAWAPDLAQEARRLMELASPGNGITYACSGYLYEHQVDITGFVMPHKECGAELLKALHATIRDPFHLHQRLLPCQLIEGNRTIVPPPRTLA